MMNQVCKAAKMLKKPAFNYKMPSCIFTSKMVNMQSSMTFGSKASELESLDQFKQYSEGNEKPTILVFGAEWCGPCKEIKPILEEKVTQYSEKIDLVMVDTDKFDEIATQYEVTSLPTTVVLHKGKEVDKIVGRTHENRTDKLVKNALNLVQGITFNFQNSIAF
eukprot:TRINITY_DN13369_c0_g1_i1.p1 TRINITY_DN13369_c0_g1~~TRINITY_DN13369_c0_g1_i1.p1  ORF type:complete len:164 (+),score=10.93 TRINITY_DN13369_c0_g1_i1:66-557(+)